MSHKRLKMDDGKDLLACPPLAPRTAADMRLHPSVSNSLFALYLQGTNSVCGWVGFTCGAFRGAECVIPGDRNLRQNGWGSSHVAELHPSLRSFGCLHQLCLQRGFLERKSDSVHGSTKSPRGEKKRGAHVGNSDFTARALALPMSMPLPGKS